MEISIQNNEVVPEQGKWLGRFAALLVWAAIGLLSFWLQARAWLAPGLGELPADTQALTDTLLQVVTLGIPLLLLAWRWPHPRYRAMFQTWLWGCGLLLALGVARFVPPAQSQLLSWLQLMGALVWLAVVYLVLWRRRPLPTNWSGTPLALGLTAVTLYPWPGWGALGSPLDVLLAALLGGAVGISVSLIVAHFWRQSLADLSRGPRHDALTGGFVVGVLLLIVASGLSLNGAQLVMMVGLPALGWLAAGVTGWPAVAVVVGLGTAVPLAFMDTDATSVIAADSILLWSFLAALASLALAWLLGAVLVWTAGRRSAPRRAALGWGAAAAALFIGGLIYSQGGQTGFHGDTLFVVLRDQADVTAAAAMPDYNARRQFVYDTLVSHADATQADLRADLDRLGVSYTPYYLVNALEVSGGWPMQVWLASRPEVDRVLPNPTLRPPQGAPLAVSPTAARPSAPRWNLTGIGATAVWQDFGVTGEGIVIGQSDSGVQWDHPELLPTYRGRSGNHDYNWYDPWTHAAVPQDAGGHGTHTLGSIVGQTVGVAPGASWYACANLPRNVGSPARYLDCMQFMLAPFPLNGSPLRDGDPLRSAHVLNNSWGCPEAYEGCDAESLRPAVAALRAAGIFVVASAGNAGPACSTVADPPALYAEAFSVGAVNEAGDLAAFSSRGPVMVDGSGRTKPDILAPGVQVLSSLPGDGYGLLDGTSMAGPHVAGVVALIWSANPALIGNIERTEEILRATATSFTGQVGTSLLAEMMGQLEDSGLSLPAQTPPEDMAGFGVCYLEGNAVPNNLTGYGIVNAYRAVEMARRGN
ncbi:MAG: S8 family serine peptidase [Chloroflexi bacterium]|nr:S8 family serine peptidase [Chloroflexota bacterium]